MTSRKPPPHDGIARPSWPAKAPTAKLEALLPLARAIAGRVCQRVPTRLSADVRAAAELGAWLVALRHPEGDPEHLRRYAITRIQGAILDELRRHDDVPRRSRQAGTAPTVLRFDQVGVLELDAALSALPEAESTLDDFARSDRLYEALAGLGERERGVIMAVDVRGRKQADVAREMGVTGARVSQLRTRALRRLREAMG